MGGLIDDLGAPPLDISLDEVHIYRVFNIDLLWYI